MSLFLSFPDKLSSSHKHYMFNNGYLIRPCPAYLSFQEKETLTPRSLSSSCLDCPNISLHEEEMVYRVIALMAKSTIQSLLAPFLEVSM